METIDAVVAPDRGKEVAGDQASTTHRVRPAGGTALASSGVEVVYRPPVLGIDGQSEESKYPPEKIVASINADFWRNKPA